MIVLFINLCLCGSSYVSFCSQVILILFMNLCFLCIKFFVSFYSHYVFLVLVQFSPFPFISFLSYLWRSPGFCELLLFFFGWWTDHVVGPVLSQYHGLVREPVSGNEQLGSNSWETRGECKWITAAHALLCWCTAASALSHLHSPRVETRRHD